MGNVLVPTTRGDLRAYLAQPTGAARGAGVIVLHEAYGLNDDIRSHTDHLAAEGYMALAPDLYSRGGPMRCLARTMAALARGRGRAFDDIEACRTWLAGQEGCTEGIGILGFCMGGGFAIACAPTGRYDAVAPNYGPVPRQARLALTGSCPIVASYGGDDWMLRGHAERLEGELQGGGIPHDLKVYPGASHSFMSHHTNGFASAMDRVLRTRFSPEASSDAWARILGFFARYLEHTP